MTRQHLDAIKRLAKAYPVPQPTKFDRRIKRLERMRVFYDAKIPEAPTAQAALFTGFVGAIMYAITILKMHRRLTNRLAELAGEETDETRTNS